MTAATTSRSLSALDVGGVELRLLRYFLVLSEELHFGRAARRLHISQPPLSQAIRKLEDQLGVDLFLRGNRGVTLTEAGRALAEEARKVLASVDHAVAETRRAGGAASGLRIGCTLHTSIEPLHHFLAALQDHDVISDPTVSRVLPVEQIRALRTGQLDLGIFPNPGDLEGVESEPLFPGEPLAAYMATSHPLAERQVVGPDELSAVTVVDFHGANPALWRKSKGLLADAGYRLTSFRDAIGSNDGVAALLAVAGGTEVAILPVSMLEASQAGAIVARRPLDPPVSMPDTVVAWRTNPSRQLARIIAGVREVARELFQAPAASSAARA
jgi:DNA-binding transcriptional LysR family regulator